MEGCSMALYGMIDSPSSDVHSQCRDLLCMPQLVAKSHQRLPQLIAALPITSATPEGVDLCPINIYLTHVPVISTHPAVFDELSVARAE